ncbi:MAG: hypothetical protein IJX47_05345 [Clostridia bacterium]|nr:hypothetical protein [Clostridia bacterium]
MELAYTETRKILRHGRASLAYRAILPQAAGERAWGEHYVKAAGALERWAADTLLPRMELSIERAPRRRRLYNVLPQLSFLCDGAVIDERRISVTVTVLLEQDGKVTRRQDFRVWDTLMGTLCPIEWFLPRKEARRYERWAFAVRDGWVWGLRSGRRQTPEPIKIGKVKYLPSSS